MVELEAELASALEHSANLTAEEERAAACQRKMEEARANYDRSRFARAQTEQALRSALEAAPFLGPISRVAVDLAEAPHAQLEVVQSEIEAVRSEVEAWSSEATRRRAALQERANLSGRLERKPAVERELAHEAERAGTLQSQVDQLRGTLRELCFDKADLDEATTLRDQAHARWTETTRRASEAGLAAARARGTADTEAKRLQDAKQQHAKAAELEEGARHLGRAADLLDGFRNTVVASVGPRLSAQAAELFGELTDHEYDRLEVDPETYEIQIRDQGSLFGMDRFSGSETDLANLALRVAISEQLRFQSGGAVGLLVLDEVFGPLDDERKERMLAALERLRARFRQVLVVTHDNAIKEQLPNAIEVVKLQGRRAAAQLL